ncbi:MAG: 16S rRNA (guanine(966)-N(2))-methyltransferase RsmD [Bacilli bacterium]
MRLISGKYKGRELKGFDILGTRPTEARVKESLFAKIMNNIQNASVLDLFAGSGNLGIEALSNGAKNCIFVDNNIKAIKTIKENINTFVQEETKVYKMDYQDALNYFKKNKLTFDIIFLDPPYQKDYIKNILPLLKKDILNKNGLVICEVNDKDVLKTSPFEVYKEGKYGDKYIIIYQKREEKND